jgi:two-component system, NtrC family, nitrogen regulation sensor histidine kinase NtrY
MTAEVAASNKTLSQRFRRWAHDVGLYTKLAIALAVAAVGSGVATYAVLTQNQFAADTRTVLLLFNLNRVLLVLLACVVGLQIIRVWRDRRRGSAGSKLHVRLLMMFAALAAAPAIVVALFSYMSFTLGVDGWFSDKIRTAVTESQAVADAYFEEHRNVIRADILGMLNDIRNEARDGPIPRDKLQQIVTTEAVLRDLPEIVLFTSEGEVMASIRWTVASAFLPFWALDKAKAGEVVVFTPGDDDKSVTGTLGDRVRGMVAVDSLPGTFLLAGRFVDPKISARRDRVREAVAAYENLEGSRSEIQRGFATTFMLMALLLVLTAMWVGLLISTHMIRPVSALIAAAEKVSAGDLAARVPSDRGSDELGTLSRAFNRMTGQLEAQHRELIDTNRLLDERRHFTETVLAGVSAGVIGLDADGRINLPNRSASTLLSLDLDRLIGITIGQAVPEMAPLFAAARGSPDRYAEGQIDVGRGLQRRTLTVRIVGERFGSDTVGFVLTFDDITELEAAQRKAAWADVARRIAHEIKNPLTPIQLSAERLKRKYLSEITSDPETFRICTETIVRQVGDIGRMVDEFSSFARMPAPVMRPEELSEIVRHTVFLQRNARPEIGFITELPDHPVVLAVDARQVAQALTNLLQNAVDSIQARDVPPDGVLPQGKVIVRLADASRGPEIAVEDNGRGFPVENRERLTEPYVTTRVKGTGLGLAIVKKIMEDHGGRVVLQDSPSGGAVARLMFMAGSIHAGGGDEREGRQDMVRVAAHGS